MRKVLVQLSRTSKGCLFRWVFDDIQKFQYNFNKTSKNLPKSYQKHAKKLPKTSQKPPRNLPTCSANNLPKPTKDDAWYVLRLRPWGAQLLADPRWGWARTKQSNKPPENGKGLEMFFLFKCSFQFVWYFFINKASFLWPCWFVDLPSMTLWNDEVLEVLPWLPGLSFRRCCSAEALRQEAPQAHYDFRAVAWAKRLKPGEQAKGVLEDAGRICCFL